MSDDAEKTVMQFEWLEEVYYRLDEAKDSIEYAKERLGEVNASEFRLRKQRLALAIDRELGRLTKMIKLAERMRNTAYKKNI